MAATEQAINDKPEAVQLLLELTIAATDYINTEPEMGFKVAADWIGTSQEIERQSMPTSGYSTADDETFHRGMEVTWRNMVRLGAFRDELKKIEPGDLMARVCDLSLLARAREQLAERKNLPR